MVGVDLLAALSLIPFVFSLLESMLYSILPYFKSLSSKVLRL